MREYFYEVIDTQSRQTKKPMTRIYIYAKPRFSHREMLSKQEQLLDKITDPDCPLDQAFQIALQRQMLVSSICVAKIDGFSRLKKELTLEFEHFMEIVAFKPVDAEKFVHWLSSIWKGKWTYIGDSETSKDEDD